MTNKSRLPKVILLVLWISALSAYLSFSSVSMPMMEMMQIDSHAAHQTGEIFSVMPCCEIIGTVCASFVCYVSEFTNIFFIKGTNRITNTNVTTQPVFLEILSPPPKT